jgi:hypothetical protein
MPQYHTVEKLREVCWFPFEIQKLEVGHEGGQFILENDQPGTETSLTYLEVPSLAIEEGEILHIHYGITPDGPFSFPDGYKLCSMVVYIVAQGAKLKKPMFLHVRHWFHEVGSQKYSFKDARCCRSPHTLDDDAIMFKFSFLQKDISYVTADDGVIEICGGNCLFATVIREDAADSYQCHIFEDKTITHTIRIAILFTFDSPTWEKIVEKHCKPFGDSEPTCNLTLKHHPGLTIDSKSDTLRLSFKPREGDKWSIYINGKQQISRASIDYRKSLPSIAGEQTVVKLQSMVLSRRYPPMLQCLVNQNAPPRKNVKICLEGVVEKMELVARVMEWGSPSIDPIPARGEFVSTSSSESDPLSPLPQCSTKAILGKFIASSV